MIKQNIQKYQKNKKKRIQEIRKLFSNAYDIIENTCQPSRETSLAITKLEEAQFWTIKGISKEKWSKQ